MPLSRVAPPTVDGLYAIEDSGLAHNRLIRAGAGDELSISKMRMIAALGLIIIINFTIKYV